jgi:hypothetical protein
MQPIIFCPYLKHLQGFCLSKKERKVIEKLLKISKIKMLMKHVKLNEIYYKKYYLIIFIYNLMKLN